MTKATRSIEGCESAVRSRGACVRHYALMLSPEEAAELQSSVRDRFWAKVDQSGECWTWTAARYRNGYGAFRGFDGRVTTAHRFSYSTEVEDIPDEQHIDHLCGTRDCVRPAHLRAVTPKQNNEHRVTPNANNRSGYRGVYFSNGRWWVKVRDNYQAHYRGGFMTLKEANEAAISLRQELFTHSRD